jgi:hypothetical protein
MLAGFQPVYAALPENASVHIDALDMQDWHLQDLNVTWVAGNIDNGRGRLHLTAATVNLPGPWRKLDVINLDCPDFGRTSTGFWCRQGHAQVRWQNEPLQTVDFSFEGNEQRHVLTLQSTRFVGGRIKVNAEKKGADWRINVNAASLSANTLAAWSGMPALEIKKGVVTVKMTLAGHESKPNLLILNASVGHIDAHVPSGRYAAEKLNAAADVQAHLKNGQWQWQFSSRINQGGLYSEPVYLDAGRDPIVFSADGAWRQAASQVDLKAFRYRHLGAAIGGNALISFKSALYIDKATLNFKSGDIANFADSYLKPFLPQGTGEGLGVSGALTFDVAIRKQALQSVTAFVNDFDIVDKNDHVQLQDGFGSLYWTDKKGSSEPSLLGWRQFKLQRLPIGPAQLHVLTEARRLELLNPARLPFLGGDIRIDRFNWRSMPGGEPAMSFQGGINDASLEQLTRALNWTPLRGTLSGSIPGIRYKNKTLTLDGQLTVHAFDGHLSIEQLICSNLLGSFPIISANMEIEGLDLEQVTGKFEFGSITGKLSGFIQQLRLENWRPVTFYAWLGTPDDDHSRHRISQKAVKNIASIGGGGATDMISRSFLSLFETFGYDQLGLGCYLHEGVCQLMGVKAAPNGGYFMITPGGLPRIEVVGYNPRVDWDILIERLKRIQASDNVIVK